MKSSRDLSSLSLAGMLLAMLCITGGAWSAPPAAVTAEGTGAVIPGPLRNFLRMAAISQKVSPDEVLPLLSRNVVVEGYQYAQDKARKPTEFLVLLKRYLEQAHELQGLAGSDGGIRIAHCEAAQPLLTVLGYRLRQACGPNTSVETADPEKAFLTIDSGFPLADLEDTLRGSKAFVCPY